MEGAPLVLAHGHARKAAEETLKTHLTAAGVEHQHAAEQYAKAEEDVTDSEALRTLRLLEEHHRKLARIVKTRDDHSKRVGSLQIGEPPATLDDTEAATSSPTKASTPAPAPSTTSEKASTPTFLKARSNPSSLAQDIASRRGIPQPQQRRSANANTNLSTVQATGRMTVPAKAGSTDRKDGRVSVSEALAAKAAATADTIAHDASPEEGFARFYANLTSGPLSKLSSMLAFAGLPLTETQEDSSSLSKPEKTSTRVTTGPDVNHLFSKAALKALEDQQRHPGTTFGPGESFYVIPTSGGTASYANIVSKAHHDSAQNPDGSGGELSDEFVDAREVMADSMRRAKHSSQDTQSSSLREEELHIENAALKQILDKLSHRLQAFESHAQDASMQALTQSMASVRTSSTVPQPEMEERMRAMQNQLEREMKEREKLGVENQKQKQVIAKYRSHWEQLKDSARARERAKKEKSEGTGSGATAAKG